MNGIVQSPVLALPDHAPIGAGPESVTGAAAGAALKLACEAVGPDRVKAALRKAVPVVSTYRLDIETLGWAGPIRQAAEDRLRVENEVAYVECGCSGPFRPLDPAVVRRKVGEVLARIVLAPGRPAGPSYLLGQIDQRLAHLGRKLSGLAERLESVTTQLRRLGGLPEFRREAEDHLGERAGMQAVQGALEQFRGRWLEALAREAESVIDGVGLDTVTEALREALLLSRPGDGASPALSADLADVAAQLRSLGLAPDGPAPGREGKRLQARHAEILKSIDADRHRHQAEVKARALALARGARDGKVDAVQQVVEIATERPAAFPDGFAASLGAVALKVALACDPSAVYYLPL